LLGFCIFCIDIFGQTLDTTSVEAQIINYYGQPLAFSPILMLNQQDSMIVKGSLTDSLGAFRILNLPYGDYYLALEKVSKDYHILDSFSFNEFEIHHNLETLLSKAKIRSLEEVLITDKKTLFLQKGDKLEVKIENTFLAKGNTGEEILPLLPGVMENADGTLELNGHSVLVLIDGKGMYNQSMIKERLKTLASENILVVEIISNPSARYDQSISSIINIKTKKKKSLSNISLGYGNLLFPYKNRDGLEFNSINPTIQFNLGNDKLKTNFLLSYGSGGEWNKYGEYGELNGERYYESSREDSIRKSYYRYSTGLEYDLSSKQTIGVEVTGGGNFFYKRFVTNVIQLPKELLVSKSQDLRKPQYLSFNSFYNITLNENGKELSVFYTFDSFNSKERTNFSNIFIIDSGFLNNTIETDINRHYKTSQFNLHFQSPISNEKDKLEIGVKYSAIQSSLDYGFSTNDSNFSAINIYKESIYAAYTSYLNTFNNTSIQAGLRYEYVASENEAESKIIKLDYNNLFPTLHINHDLKKYQLSFSYGKKIRRPNLYNLSSILQYRNPLYNEIGRPEIKPTITHRAELKISNKSNINLSLSYSSTRNWYVALVDSINIFNFKYASIRKVENYHLNLYIRQKVFKIWQIITNTSLSYYRSETFWAYLNNTAFGLNLSLTNKITLPKSYRLEASLQYFGPYTLVYYFNQGFLSVNLKLKKAFLKDRLMLSLRLRDVFGTSKSEAMRTYGGAHFVYYQGLSNRRSMSIGLSYNFKTGNRFQKKNKKAKNFREHRI